MGDMLSDINKYAKIWDSALEKGIFDDAPKPPQPDSLADRDFFGQYQIEDDAPLNEVDTKYWDRLSKMAGLSGKYVDPLIAEEVSTKDDIAKASKAVAAAHNPINIQSVGKDQDVDVTQNWGVGGKAIEQLEELKVRLEKMESKLNGLEGNGSSGKDVQSKINSLKDQIDDLSNTISGDRFEPR